MPSSSRSAQKNTSNVQNWTILFLSPLFFWMEAKVPRWTFYVFSFIEFLHSNDFPEQTIDIFAYHKIYFRFTIYYCIFDLLLKDLLKKIKFILKVYKMLTDFRKYLIHTAPYVISRIMDTFKNLIHNLFEFFSNFFQV